MSSVISILTKRRFALALLTVAALSWAGCDSSEDEDTDGDFDDAALLVGTWEATAIKADAGAVPVDIQPILGLELEITLEEDGDARLVVTEDDGSTTELSGQYTVDETAKTITLSDDDLDDDLVLDYSFEDEDNLTVELKGSDLSDIGIELPDIGLDLENLTIIVEVTRVGS